MVGDDGSTAVASVEGWLMVVNGGWMVVSQMQGCQVVGDATASGQAPFFAVNMTVEGGALELEACVSSECGEVGSATASVNMAVEGEAPAASARAEAGAEAEETDGDPAE